MAALPDPLSYQALPSAAPELPEYPQFKACPVPLGSGATKAYKGFIRPFSDDATARRVLQAIEENLPIQVFEGRLDAEPPEPKPNPLAGFLVDMALPFTILLLEFPGSEHARTFLFDPPMIPRFSRCAHLRTDKSIKIDGESFPALCVYSGSLQRFDNGRSRQEQLLDQTATYLAKYLIWLRTRKLYRQTPYGPQLVRLRGPLGKVTLSELSQSSDFFWHGYWPGPSAPTGPAAHLATINPGDECWCWSGDTYGKCCRPREFAAMVRFENAQFCAQFVNKLMAVVRSRL